MSNTYLKNTAKIVTLAAIFTGCFIVSGYAASAKAGRVNGKADKLTRSQEEKFTELQKMARSYRNEGLNAQNIGDIDSAAKFYQKAIQIDPAYPAPYNDLGVLYEGSGMLDQARDLYLKALEVDPNYLSAYTNLAMFYEFNRDLPKALYYWQKRAQLGQLEDPWTAKAKQRVDDLRLVLSDTPILDAQEADVIGLTKDLSNQKDIYRKDNKALAKDLMVKANRYYVKGNLASAFKFALDAQQLDPDNKEIDNFIDKVQERALSR